MAGVVHNPGQEFWQPPLAQASEPVSRLVEVCDRCGTEFVMGARYCHVCGGSRASLGVGRSFGQWAALRRFKDSLGLGTPSLVAFILGVGCVVASALMGVIFTAATVLDWQAVQVWRIEWLLGAVVAFLASILLKHKTES